MKRSELIRLFLVPTVAVTFACGGDGGGESAESEAPAADVITVDAATAGTLVGTISFDGQAPDGEAIDMSEEPTCAEKHDGQPMKMPAMVGPDGGLANVFVHITEGLPEGTWSTPSQPAELDQDGCIYRPHVMGVQTGQTLVIRNSDGLLHNINAQPDNQRGFNISQPTNMTTERTFNRPEVMIPVRCDVHGWMEAYVGVQEHPYFAVTDGTGAFTIGNLPPGDYTVEAWHERYGVQTATVTIAESGEATADFTFSESMAGAPVPLGEPVDLHDHGAASSGP
ncbi:MAG: carboxypeptidase regulatory-like domain-containing protein [Longimicrobiales bacterium]|nr:carboxypeptidase regulatory-like domain-containing protein [Longimicrobiales bacterium]